MRVGCLQGLYLLVIVAACTRQATHVAPPPLRAPIATATRISTSAAAIAELERGFALDDAEDRPGAIARYRRALELDPEFALAHAALAAAGEAGHAELALARAARLPDAERHWVHALVGPTDTRGAALIAAAAAAPGEWRIHKWLAFHSMWSSLDNQAGRRAFETVLALRPDDVDAQTYLPLFHCDEQRFEAALAVAHRFADREPMRPIALETLAEVQLMAGDLSAAEATYRKLLALEPGSVTALEGVASVRFHRGEWEPGIAGLRAAAATAPTPVARELQAMVMWALVARQQPDAARAELRALAASERDDPEEIRIAVEARDWTRVLALTEGARDRWPLAFRVIAASRTGDLAEAGARLAELEAIELPADQPWLANERRIARAHVALATGDHTTAIALFTHRLVLNHNSLYDPRRGRAHPGFDHFALSGRVHAAETHLRAGDRAAARALLEPIIRSYRVGIGAVAARQHALELSRLL